MALVAVRIQLFVYLIYLNGIVCLSSSTENELLDSSQSLPFTTPEKVSNVLRDILNQESLVRLSMVQKIQRLMMDAIDNKNFTESVMKRLNDITKSFHALETRQQKMEEKNSRLYEELQTMRSTIGYTINLTSDNTDPLNETEISLLGKQTSSLQNKIHELTLENTEIKAQLEAFIEINKTYGEPRAICDQLKQEIEQIKRTDLDSLKNETLLLMQRYVSLSDENKGIQTNLIGMNKTITDNDFNTRLRLAQGQFMTFSDFVNRTMGRLLENQKNATKKLMNISTQLSETLLSPITMESVAFYAYMSQSTPTISVQYSLKFDVVKTNVGNGYHSATGVFIVPETGIYVFTWTIRVYDDYHHSTQLMVNTDELGSIHVDSGSGNIGGTGIAVAKVNAGDDVFVRTLASWNKGPIISDSGGRSSFAGWKLS